jgi:preprotein translocase subunit SecE
MAKEKTEVEVKEKKQKSSEKSSKPEKKNSLFKKIAKYFKDLKSEFKKVVWPTKQQVFNNTVVVLSCMVIMGLFIFGLDSAFMKLLELLIKK